MGDYSYTIITDGATDMPFWIREKYNLKVLPTPVVIDGKDYFDGETIMAKDFYNIQREGKAVISTYHVSQLMFYEAFKPFAEQGQPLVYFGFSTGIAGTINAARLAKEDLKEEFPDWECDIIDSKCASFGFGLGVYMALMMQEKGASKEEVIEAARFHFDNMEHIVTVETLDYLYRGGRISKTAAIAGGLLEIKPVINVNDDGALEVCDKVRGRKKSIRRVIDIMGERGVDLDKQIVAVIHADCDDVADTMVDEIKSRFGCKTVMKEIIGAAIGAHTGPGLVGVVFLSAASPYRLYFE